MTSQLYLLVKHCIFIIEIVVNYYDLYDDLPTNIVVTSQFAHAQTKVINETFLKLFAVKALPYFKKPWAKVTCSSHLGRHDSACLGHRGLCDKK